MLFLAYNNIAIIRSFLKQQYAQLKKLFIDF